jgi:hypothetical protein
MQIVLKGEENNETTSIITYPIAETSEIAGMSFKRAEVLLLHRWA